jgi:hypothetical protein
MTDEKLDRLIAAVHSIKILYIEPQHQNTRDVMDKVAGALRDLKNEVSAVRRTTIKEAAEAAEKHALSEGWSHSSALRFRNCILALRSDS